MMPIHQALFNKIIVLEVIITPAALDLTGQRFGNFTAIKRAPNKSDRTYWLCRCDCGREEEVRTTYLTCGKKTMCRVCAGFKKPEKEIFEPHEQKCPICGKIFFNTVYNRHYCYDCMPEGIPPERRQFYKQRALKHFLVGYKGGKCEICGYNNCEGALEFHHINPQEKDKILSRWRFQYDSDIKNFIKEADKCRLLCANCHREQHYDWTVIPAKSNDEEEVKI